MAICEHDRGWENEFLLGQSGLSSGAWQFTQNKICQKGEREGDFYNTEKDVPSFRVCLEASHGIVESEELNMKRNSCQCPDMSDNLTILYHNMPFCHQLEVDVFSQDSRNRRFIWHEQALGNRTNYPDMGWKKCA